MPATGTEIQSSTARRKLGWGVAVILAIVAGGTCWFAWQWREQRRYQAARSEIEADIDNGRFALAVRKLSDLLAWRPDSDEALLLLGLCEKERGRPENALIAWSKVSPRSPLATKALASRVELEIDRGRLAQAEQLVKETADSAGGDTDASGPSILLGPVYCQEGRVDEALRLIEARWDYLDQAGEGASEKAINLIRLHIELSTATAPVEVIRAFLDRAGRANPRDDRVWLGRANLAIRTGALDQAPPLLQACLGLRPDDFPIWRAKLKWAMAARRVAEAKEALAKLPAAEATPAEMRKLAAWFDAQHGDLEGERRALEQVLEEDPSDSASRDRLIEIATKSGRTEHAADLKRQKNEIERLEQRYRQLYRRNQPARDAEEMARLAGQLGRWFEARVFLRIASAVDPDRAVAPGELAALKRHTDSTSELGRTLAGVLSSELDAMPDPEPPLRDHSPSPGRADVPHAQDEPPLPPVPWSLPHSR